MIQSRTLRALCFGMLGASLALTGCKKSDSGAPPQASFAFDGTGAEALGYYVAEVTASSGIYNTASPAGTLPGNQSTATGKIAPVGFTQHLQLYQSGSSLTIHQSMGYGNDFSLVANTATGTYVGTNVWAGFGALQTANITETWTLRYSGTTVTLTVAGTTDEATPQTGALTMVLRPIASEGGTLDTDFYGRNTAASDSRRVDGTTYLTVNNWSPGTYSYWAPDAASEWNDYFYIDALYRSGSTLKGGGFLDGNYYSDDSQDRFVALTVGLDATGRPTSATGTVNDWDNWDNAGLQDATEATTWSVSSAGFKSVEQYRALYQAPNMDLTVTSVTGVNLTSIFGPATTVNANMASFSGESFDIDGNSFYGGYVSNAQQKVAVWDKGYYDYYNNYPSYDVDNDAATLDRLTWTINYNTSALPATPTGGSLAVQFYNAAGTITGTENLAFTLGNPGPYGSYPGNQYHYIPVNVPVNVTIAATNTTSFAVTSGTLPTGLTLNTTTGAITGTPTVTGGWNYIQVTLTGPTGKTTVAYINFYIHS